MQSRYLFCRSHGRIDRDDRSEVAAELRTHANAEDRNVEAEMKHSGTFMCHPHSHEMVQMAMGMMEMIIMHPRIPEFRPVDRDFGFIMSTYLIDSGAYLPKVKEMIDFRTWNSRVFLGVDPLAIRFAIACA